MVNMSFLCEMNVREAYIPAVTGESEITTVSLFDILNKELLLAGEITQKTLIMGLGMVECVLSMQGPEFNPCTKNKKTNNKETPKRFQNKGNAPT